MPKMTSTTSMGQRLTYETFRPDILGENNKLISPRNVNREHNQSRKSWERSLTHEKGNIQEAQSIQDHVPLDPPKLSPIASGSHPIGMSDDSVLP